MVGRFALVVLLFVPALASYVGFAFSFASYVVAGPMPTTSYVQAALVFLAVVPALLAIIYPILQRYVADQARGSVADFLVYLFMTIGLFGVVAALGVYVFVHGYINAGELALLFGLAIMALACRVICSRAPGRLPD